MLTFEVCNYSAVFPLPLLPPPPLSQDLIAFFLILSTCLHDYKTRTRGKVCICDSVTCQGYTTDRRHCCEEDFTLKDSKTTSPLRLLGRHPFVSRRLLAFWRLPRETISCCVLYRMLLHIFLVSWSNIDSLGKLLCTNYYILETCCVMCSLHNWTLKIKKQCGVLQDCSLFIVLLSNVCWKYSICCIFIWSLRSSFSAKIGSG